MCKLYTDESSLHTPVIMHTCTRTHSQNLLRLSFSSVSAGMSPDATLQPHSLPSSVSDALEAMVGGGLDDLTLEDIDPSNLTDDPSEVGLLV